MSISARLDPSGQAVDNDPMDGFPRNRTQAGDFAPRLHDALTADGERLFGCLQDPSFEVLRAAMNNPALCKDHLLVLLKRRDLPETLLTRIYQLEQTRACRRVRLMLVKNPAAPASVVQALLPQLYLFELADLCFLPGGTPDLRLAAERNILLRLEGEPLGNRIALARRGTAAVVGELLKCGDPHLLQSCLDSPRLKEAAILQFLRGPKVSAESISAIARHRRWKTRPNLRQALLRNRRTPRIWFTLWLPGMPVKELRTLLLSRQLNALQQGLVKAELKRRPGR